METNFFSTIANLALKGDVQITIRQDQDKLIVATMLLNESCGDKAKKIIPPAILNGTPDGLDKGYFANTAAPLQATSQLFVNMEAYLKAQEVAQQNSRMKQQKTTEETKAEDEKTRKYRAAIKKPEELASQGKHREAWAKYPEPTDFPDFADTIRKRRLELSSHFAPDLFASAAKTETTDGPSDTTTLSQTHEATIEDDLEDES